MDKRAVQKVNEEKRSPRRWKYAAAVILCAAAAGSAALLLEKPASSMEGEIYCGYEEHIHTEECYAAGTLTHDLSVQGHVHTDACYDEQGALICTEPDTVCGQTEHVHSLQCYSDPAADAEDETVWETPLKAIELTGNWNEDVLTVAKTQLGYTESTKNYKVSEDGAVNGYTRYGEWCGEKYTDWSTAFCCFCLHYANVDETVMPRSTDCDLWIAGLTEMGLYKAAAEEYVPVGGDIVFFDTDKDELADAAGFVCGLTETSVEVIMGDAEDEVQCIEYDRNDESIVGWGVMPIDPEFDGEVIAEREPAQVVEETEEYDETEFDPEQSDESPRAALSSVFAASPVSLLAEAPEPPEEPGEPVYVTSFDFYYRHDGSRDVTETDDFDLKYQLAFTTQGDPLPKFAVRIRIPRALYMNRYGSPVNPTDIGVPAGKPAEGQYKVVSCPFNYYTETVDGVEYLVFFNTAELEAGNSSYTAYIQVLFNGVSVMAAKDKTEWSLPAYVSIDGGKTYTQYADKSGAPICLTGRINAGINDNVSAAKVAYSRDGGSITPGLYTEAQIRTYADLPEGYDFDLAKYHYVVWQVNVTGGSRQPWELYLRDTTDNNGELVGVKLKKDRQGADVNITKVEDAASPYKGLYLAASSMKKKAIDLEYYVVTRYPNCVQGTTLTNTVDAIFHLYDAGNDPQKDIVKTAVATTVWMDYKWKYNGEGVLPLKSPTAVFNAKLAGEEAFIPGWMTIYGVRKESGEAGAMGNIPFSTESMSNAFLFTYKTGRSEDGSIIVESGTDHDGAYVPGSYMEIVTGEDVMIAYDVNDPMTGHLLDWRDYWFDKITVSRNDRKYDFYEQMYTDCTPDSELGAADFDRDAVIYVKYGKDGAGNLVSAEPEWEEVTKIAWDGTGQFTYSFTPEQLAREPFRVKAVYKSVDYSLCDISVNTVIRYDSPVFESMVSKGTEQIRLEDLCSQTGTYRQGFGGTVYTIKDDTGNYDEDIALGGSGLTDVSVKLYGVKPIRGNAWQILKAIEPNAEASKSGSYSNNPEWEQLDLTYTVNGFEGYYCADAGDPSILMENGVTTLADRTDAEIYDLLPRGVSFDPSVAVTASRITAFDNNKGTVSGTNKSQVTVTVDEKADVHPNWNGTGRTMVVFHVHYEGADPSSVSMRKDVTYWFTGYQVKFGAYCKWRDIYIDMDKANLAAYMPAGECTEPLVGKDSQVYKDDGTGSAVYPKYFGADINRDGVTDKRTVLYATSDPFGQYATSSVSAIGKLVRAESDTFGAFTPTTVVSGGEGYTYKLTMMNDGLIPETNVFVFDRLENAAIDRKESQGEMTCEEDWWLGTFAGVDLTEAKALGLAPVVWYNTSRDAVIPEFGTTPGTVLTAANGWYTAEDYALAGFDLKDVKAVGFDLSKRADGTDFILGGLDSKYSSVSLEIDMTAPEETGAGQTYAYNNPVLCYTTNTDDGGNIYDTVHGYAIKVRYNHPRAAEFIKRVPEGTPEQVRSTSFAFELRSEATGTYVANTTYELYELRDGEWVQNESRIWGTDEKGRFYLTPDQKAKFTGAGTEFYEAVELAPDIRWTEEDTDYTQDSIRYFTYTNTFHPVLFVTKGSIEAVPEGVDMSRARFTFVLKDKNGEPVSGAVYYMAKSITANQNAVPQLVNKTPHTTDENGEFTLGVKEIAAFPLGAEGDTYTVGEKADTSWTPAEGSITVTQGPWGSEASFRNYYRYKSLTISKKLTYLEPEDCGAQFSFIIKVKNGEDFSPVPGLKWSMDNGKDAEPTTGTTDENGRLTAACAGKSIVVQGLEEGKTYRVEEYTDENELAMVYDGESFTSGDYLCLTEAKDFVPQLKTTNTRAEFTNKYLRRDLVVTKTVLGTASAAYATEFSFTLMDSTGAVMPGQKYDLVYSDGYVEEGYLTDENGCFTLMHGEKAIFRDIGRVGDTFRVSEAYTEGYALISPYDNSENAADKYCAITLADADKETSQEFVNGSPGVVVVMSKLIGLNELGEKAADALNTRTYTTTFKLKLDKGDGNGFVDPVAEDGVCYYILNNSTNRLNTTKNTYDTVNGASCTYLNSLVITSDNTDFTKWTVSVEQAEVSMGKGDFSVSLTGDDELLTMDDHAIYDRLTAMTFRKDGAKTADMSKASRICFENTVKAMRGDRVYKLVTEDVPIAAGSEDELVLRLERWNGTSWLPAAGESYLISTRDLSVDEDFSSEASVGDMQTTGKDGIVRFAPADLPAGAPFRDGSRQYAFYVAVFTEHKLTAGMALSPETGDLRLVELPEQSAAGWGRLAYYLKGVAIEENSEDPTAILNEAPAKLLFAAKALESGTDDQGDDFTFGLEQLVWLYDDEDGYLPAAKVSYDVFTLPATLEKEEPTLTKLLAAKPESFDTAEELGALLKDPAAVTEGEYNTYDEVMAALKEAGCFVRSGETDAQGRFTLKAGQLAALHVTDSRWRMTEYVNYPYEIADVIVTGENASVRTDGKPGASWKKAGSTAVLETGPELNAHLGTEVERIRFEYDEEFKGAVTEWEGTPVDAEHTGSIMLYTSPDGKTAYVLSESKILANEDSSEMFKNKSALNKINFTNFDTSNVTSMVKMFRGCEGLTTLDVSGFDTSNVTEMYDLFYGCSGLKTLDVTGFDTSNVTDMYEMFYGCESLTALDVTGFDTSNVTSMYNLFCGCKKLKSLDVSSFDTSNVKGFTWMFGNCSSLTELDVTGFDTSKATSIAWMFSGCSGLKSLDVTGFHTENVEVMNNVFSDCSGLTELDVTSFDTSNAHYTYGMFSGCSGLKSLDVTGFDTSKVTKMSHMFSGCSGLTELDLSSFDTTGSVGEYAYDKKSMEGMFMGCSGLTELDLSSFDTSTVTDMREMFRNCTNLKTLDLSSFDVSEVTMIWDMFDGCRNLETIYAGDWTENSRISAEKSVFTSCLKLPVYKATKISGAYCKPVENGGYFISVPAPVLETGPAFNSRLGDGIENIIFGRHSAYLSTVSGLSGVNVDRDGTGSIRLYVSEDGKTAYVLSTAEMKANPDSSGMLSGCSGLKSVDLSGLDTSEVTNMSSVFSGCSGLKSVDLSGLNTSEVTNMSSVFSGCSGLTELDLSGLDTSGVTNMSSMFSGCSGLTELDLKPIDTSAATNMSGMFNGCGSLEAVDLRKLNTSNVTDMSYMFNGCGSLTELELSKFDTSAVLSAGHMFSDCAELETIHAKNWTGNVSIGAAADVFTGSVKLPGYDASDTTGAKCKSAAVGGYFAEPSPAVLESGPDFNKRLKSKVQSVTFGTEAEYAAAVSGISGISVDEDHLGDIKLYISADGKNAYVLSEGKIAANPDSSKMFYYLSNLTSVDFKGLDTSGVTDMSTMFGSCTRLTSLDLSGFDTSNVTDMSEMFYYCSSLASLNLSSFNTSNVTDMNSMFCMCSALTELDVSRFNTSRVTNMQFMFYVCSKLTELDLKKFDTANVTNTSYMFYGCAFTELDLSSFRTPCVTNMEYMFYNCSRMKTLNISGFDTSSVVDMGCMFQSCVKLTSLNVSDFKTQNVTNMSHMFSSCSSLTELNVSGFDTTKVKNMSSMFSGCSKLTTIDVSSFKTSNVESMSGMFSKSGFTSLNLSGFDTRKVKNMSEMFSECKGLTNLDLRNFVTPALTSASSMFMGCSNLKSVDLSSLITTNVTDMSYMFDGCSALESLDVKGFDTANVKSMRYMFSACSTLKSLDVSGFDTSAVTDMQNMFSGCTKLAAIYAGDWTGNINVGYSYYVFKNCTSLPGFNASNTSGEYCKPTTMGGYFTTPPTE